MNAADRLAGQRESRQRHGEQREAQADQPALVPVDEDRADGEAAEAGAEAPRRVQPVVLR